MLYNNNALIEPRKKIQAVASLWVGKVLERMFLVTSRAKLKVKRASITLGTCLQPKPNRSRRRLTTKWQWTNSQVRHPSQQIIMWDILNCCITKPLTPEHRINRICPVSLPTLSIRSTIASIWMQEARCSLRTSSNMEVDCHLSLTDNQLIWIRTRTNTRVFQIQWSRAAITLPSTTRDRARRSIARCKQEATSMLSRNRAILSLTWATREPWLIQWMFHRSSRSQTWLIWLIHSSLPRASILF